MYTYVTPNSNSFIMVGNFGFAAIANREKPVLLKSKYSVILSELLKSTIPYTPLTKLQNIKLKVQARYLLNVKKSKSIS